MALPRLQSAQLRNRIEVKRVAEVSDGKGGYTDEWQPFCKAWAEVLGQDGREAVIGRALEGISTYRIRMRWIPNQPKQDDQILYDGKTLNIRSVSDPDGQREQLVILADTGSARNMG